MVQKQNTLKIYHKQIKDGVGAISFSYKDDNSVMPVVILVPGLPVHDSQPYLLPLQRMRSPPPPPLPLSSPPQCPTPPE